MATLRGIAALVVMSCAGVTASAAPVDWVNWQSFTPGSSGVATGTMSTASGPIAATYSGNLYDAWLSPLDSGNDDPWPGPPFYTAYDSPLIDNRPPNHQVLWQVRGVWSSSITFSQPVSDVYMTIYSLGGGVGELYGVNYDFDTPFDITCVGNGKTGLGVLTQLSGDILHGEEGNGIIHFAGPLTTLSWTTSFVAYEGVNGFTFGAAAVPAPGPVLLSVLAVGTRAIRRSR